jgi:type I restriction enzyme, S subunit
MSFPVYEEYKDSGVEWLGKIPTTWLTRRLVFCLSSLESGSREKVEEGEVGEIPSLGGEHIGFDSQIKTRNMRYITRASFETLRTGQIEKDDVLLVKDGATIGKVALVTDLPYPECAVNEHVFILRSNSDCSPNWLFYNLQTSEIQQGIWERVTGSAQPGLNSGFTKYLTLCLPDFAEQTAIASFLDAETSKIDSLVSEQRRLIELLKEKRQAVISHAVTKGLNPDVKMKESGIEWLGEVPEHWEIERGRFLYRKRDLPPQPDDGVVTSFRDGQVTLRTNRRTDGFTMAILEVGYQRVLTGDLVIHGMDAFAGAIGVSESTGKCTPEYSVLVPARDGMENQYFAKLLRLMALRNYIYVICPSVRQRAPRFRYTSFKDVSLPVPPHDEQVEIVRLIESKSTELDSLVAQAERTIELLQERRTALISAAVTGKIDVRELATEVIA